MRAIHVLVLATVLSQPPPPARAEALPLRIADLPARSAVASTNGFAATLVGRIDAKTDDWLILDDGTGRLLVYTDCEPLSQTPGDRIRLDCRIWRTRTTGEVFASRARNAVRLAREKAPDVIEMPASDVVVGKAHLQLVRTHGVVTDAFRDEADSTWLEFVVETDNAHFIATIRDKAAAIPMSNALAFIDREVDVTGVCTVPRNAQLPYAYDEPILYLGSLADIRLRDEGRPRQPGFPHRQRVTGTVVSPCGRNAFFLAADDGRRLRVRAAAGERPAASGTRVSVAGFLRRNRFLAWLDNATVAAEAAGAPFRETPADVSARDILRDDGGRLAVTLGYHGRLVRLRGRAVSLSQSADAETTLVVDCDGVRFPVHLGTIPPPPLDGTVSVTGGCRIICEASEGPVHFGRLGGFEVYPRTADDIVLLVRPPWWTPFHLGVVIVCLLLGLLGVGVWNRLLKNVIERQSRHLLKARLSKVQATLRAKERTAMAIELHDALSQNLTGVGLQLAISQRARPSDPDAANRHVDTALRLVKSCRLELDRCLHDLRSTALDCTDFARAIEQTLEPTKGMAAVTIRACVDRSLLGDHTAHAALCIIRELTANAIRHGKATRVRIAAENRMGALNLSVTDNGCGFPPGEPAAAADGHFGLTGIRERLKRLGGTLRIGPHTPGGTRIAVTIPQPATRESK